MDVEGAPFTLITTALKAAVSGCQTCALHPHHQTSWFMRILQVKLRHSYYLRAALRANTKVRNGRPPLKTQKQLQKQPNPPRSNGLNLDPKLGLPVLTLMGLNKVTLALISERFE